MLNIRATQNIDTQYKYWRLRILYSMYVGYAVFYLTRKSFTFIIPALISKMHISTVDIGIISSLFYITYGCSKFLSGIVSDKINARYFMAFGLFATGIANIVFSFSSSLNFFILLWMLNAFFQGWGWPPCAKLLTHWYSRKERGRWWGAWNTCHNVGGALIPLIVAASIHYWNWRYAMFIPGVIAIVGSVFLVSQLRDIPTSMGLPSIEEYNGEPAIRHNESTQSTKEILYRYVFFNRYLWILALSYVLIYVTRTAINDWGAVYLTAQGYSMKDSIACLSFFEIGGFFGSLAAGWMSDSLFSGMRGQTNTLFSMLTIFAVMLLWLIPGNTFFLHAACIFLIGFAVFGPQMLIGVAAAELSHKSASGASTGFIGLFAYLGAALSGYPIGVILKHLSWGGFFVTLTLCAIAATALLASLWSTQKFIPQQPEQPHADALTSKTTR